MASQIDSRARSIPFSFQASGCLYRGFAGERVLVDCEGGGTLFAQPADIQLTIVRRPDDPAEFPMVFRDRLKVTSAELGTYCAEVLTGAPEGLLAELKQRVRQEFQGAGWLVGGVGRCQVDDRHEWIDFSDGPRTVPVFRGFAGEGEFEVVPATGSRCILADAWDISDLSALRERKWTVQNMSRLRELDSAFADGDRRVAQTASHLNAASWVSAIPANNRGLILRKYYDRFHGRQRARVRIDGEVVGVWYEPKEDRQNRWAVSDFGIAPDPTQQKSEITVTIEPPSGTSLWSVSRVEVWALVPV